MRDINLSSGLGEVMAPQTLVTALVIGPDGAAEFDAGALHGRSRLEHGLQWAVAREQVPEPSSAWLVWVAIELDGANQPVRFKGLSVSHVLINPVQRLGYKSLADHVNRISEAVQGRVTLARLDPAAREQVPQQLRALSSRLWQAASPEFRNAVESLHG